MADRDPAAELIEIAQALASEGRAAPAARLRQIAGKLEQTGPSNAHDAGFQQARECLIDAGHFTGLAQLYADRGEVRAAFECLEVAKRRAPFLPHLYRLHGQLLARSKEWENSALLLRESQRYNPFDTEVAELLAKVEFELGANERALEATIDAILLQKNEDTKTATHLRRQMRGLKKRLKMSQKEVKDLFQSRQQNLQRNFDQLQSRREKLIKEATAGIQHVTTSPIKNHQVETATRLRKIGLWARLDDESIYELAGLVSQETHPAGHLVFGMGTAGRDMFFVETGQLVLSRPTPYGEFTIHVAGPGDLLGEINFVTTGGRTTDARAQLECELLRIDSEKLEQLTSERPELGVKIYSSLWQSLALKLRNTNEQLARFFASQQNPGGDMMERSAPAPVEVDASMSAHDTARFHLKDKLSVFHEQGLTHSDLATLATFSRELSLEPNTYLFHEGDPGNDMFVVLSGKIRISKLIPGGGEEALEIVGRGGFFGEIALVDGQPRSADARAHEGAATVLALDRNSMREVLSHDASASLEFLRLLCRLLASRLREVDEKIVVWRILSGPASASQERKITWIERTPKAPVAT